VAVRSTVHCKLLLHRSQFSRRTVALQHDLTGHTSLLEQLVRAFRFGQRYPMRDERLDLLLLEEFK
jgi:hypothetical protein